MVGDLGSDFVGGGLQIGSIPKVIDGDRISAIFLLEEAALICEACGEGRWLSAGPFFPLVVHVEVLVV